MLKDYMRLALGSLRKRLLRTMLTLIGIFIGIAAVVALISLGQGLQDAVNAQFASVGTDKIIVQASSTGFGPPGQSTASKITTDDLELVEGVNGVERVASRILESVVLDDGQVSTLTFAGSLPEQAEGRALVLEAVNRDVVKGRMLKPNEKGKIVVTQNFADKAILSKPLEVGKKIFVNDERYEIVGIIEESGQGGFILINEDDLRDLTGNEDELSLIVADVFDEDRVTAIADSIERTLRRDRGQEEGFEDFTVQTSEELIASVNTIIGVIRAVFIGVALISLLVGGIGIMNTMYTAVLERTRDIGIMKAIGAKNSDIFFIFLFESGLLGLVGGAIGVLLGMSLSKGTEILGRQAVGDVLAASFPWYLLVGSLAFSFLIGAASGLFPARQASRMPPVEALQHD